MTLTETTKKLGVNFYEYIQDRVRQTNQIPIAYQFSSKKVQELSWVGRGLLPNRTATYCNGARFATLNAPCDVLETPSDYTQGKSGEADSPATI